MNISSTQCIQFLLALCIFGCAASCNTVKGAGRDIQRSGEAVESAAENAQK